MGVEDIMGTIKLSKRRCTGQIIGRTNNRGKWELKISWGPSNLLKGDVQDVLLEEQTTGSLH